MKKNGAKRRENGAKMAQNIKNDTKSDTKVTKK